jgi:hypothetical protein
MGWSVRFFGSNLAGATVLSALEEDPADTLCISTTLVANLPAAAELVNSVRATLGVKSPRIVVGGAAFEAVPGFARENGAIAGRVGRGALDRVERTRKASRALGTRIAIVLNRRRRPFQGGHNRPQSCCIESRYCARAQPPNIFLQDFDVASRRNSASNALRGT